MAVHNQSKNQKTDPKEDFVAKKGACKRREVFEVCSGKQVHKCPTFLEKLKIIKKKTQHKKENAQEYKSHQTNTTPHQNTRETTVRVCC